MIFKHNKNISRNFTIFFFYLLLVSACGGGGAGAEKPIEPVSFSVIDLPSSAASYEAIAIKIVPNVEGCTFQINSEDLLWINSTDGLNFNFRAPIIYTKNQEFALNISAVSNSAQPRCLGSKTLVLDVTRNQTEFIPNPDPTNIPYLATSTYSIHDIGLGGIEISQRYSATVCYPTDNDCVTYSNELFGQDAHNMAVGDFNGDGYEDFVVAWAIFPHTIDQSKKIYAPVNIYLNDQDGGFAEDINLYSSLEAPVHPFAYRLVVDDLNGDGLDDVFAGSMGLSVEQGKSWGIRPYPHFLLLSNAAGQFEESAENINDDNNGLGQLCSFAHDASGGDPDGDGDIDIFACNMLLVNDGQGNFSIHSFLNLDWHYQFNSPMSSLLADLNNDGFDDILFWNFNDRQNFDLLPEEGFILLSDGTKVIENWTKAALPPGPFGINKTKFNHAAKGDLNNDGFIDVVIGITRAEPYYEGAYIQILINDGSGMLVDETAARFVNQQRATSHHGEGNIYVRDMNLDGALDIVHSTRDFQSSLHGAHVAINDGIGNFQSLTDSILPNRPDQGFNSTDALFKGLPINADNLGCLDLISTTDSWQDARTQRNYLFSILNTDCSF